MFDDSFKLLLANVETSVNHVMCFLTLDIKRIICKF